MDFVNPEAEDANALIDGILEQNGGEDGRDEEPCMGAGRGYGVEDFGDDGDDNESEAAGDERDGEVAEE